MTPAPPTTTRASTLAWIRLMRVFQKIDHESAERFRQYGLSVARFDMLNHAGTSEGRTQQEIASSLLVTKGNITQLLDAMERDGLLVRQKDGRSNRIYLTDEGRALRETMVSCQEAAIEKSFSVLADDEVAELSRILRKLDRSLGPP